MTDLYPVTARYRIINGVMKYAYESARSCGENGEQAQREASVAAQFVKELMG